MHGRLLQLSARLKVRVDTWYGVQLLAGGLGRKL